MSYKITLLPGDGIGVEVIDSAVQVLLKTAEKFNVKFNIEEKLFGGSSIDKFGTPLTEETLQSCFSSDAVLMGAVGGYKWENIDHKLKPEAGLLRLRKELELFANIRPAKVYSSLVEASSLKRDVVEGTDFIVFRELTGGIYFGEPRGFTDEKGWNTMVYSKYEIERIARLAFQTALKRKKVLTSVDKANVLECSQLWRKTVNEINLEYPDVKVNHMYVDNAAMQIVRDPKQFDIILTSNLFGDILSDISGMITGSLGMLPSASLGNKYSLYEPIHGSAPDIAGLDKANPIATILSVAMMFDYSFNLKEAANYIINGVEKTLEQGFRTTDIGKKDDKIVGTKEITQLILTNLNNI
ncbi:MAG: 3-isopropylmalate dehydrogenase [bacterium]